MIRLEQKTTIEYLAEQWKGNNIDDVIKLLGHVKLNCVQIYLPHDNDSVASDDLDETWFDNFKNNIVITNKKELKITEDILVPVDYWLIINDSYDTGILECLPNDNKLISGFDESDCEEGNFKVVNENVILK